MAISHLYPTQRPALDLNFARQKRLDSRVTFTRGSTATYVGSDGLIKTAASGEARFDHDPETGESLGLLVEESRTNLFTYSQDFSNAVWNKARVTVTPNAGLAPDGSNTASKVVEDTATGGHGVGLSVVNNTYKTATVYAKAAERSWIALYFYDTARGASAAAIFNLADGTISRSPFCNASIEELPNGWYRLRMGRQANAGSAFYVRTLQGDVVPTYDGSVFSYAGDGVSGVLIWGAQLENLATFPTSYIPTSGSTVTRSADVVSMTGTNFSSWYNQSEGTVFCDVITRCPFGGGNSTSNVGVSFVLSDGTSNNIIYVQRPPEGGAKGDNFKPVIYSSGSAVLNVEVTDAWPANVPNRQIIAYKVNDFNYSVNGVVGSSVTTGSAPSGIDRLDIGQMSFGTYNRIKAGTFSRFTYYPTRLTNAQLQALTL